MGDDVDGSFSLFYLFTSGRDLMLPSGGLQRSGAEALPQIPLILIKCSCHHIFQTQMFEKKKMKKSEMFNTP